MSMRAMIVRVIYLGLHPTKGTLHLICRRMLYFLQYNQVSMGLLTSYVVFNTVYSLLWGANQLKSSQYPAYCTT
ncbi:hypothetical protein PALU110988_08950 [Paenibacillus lupini]|nr:hypothetical protein [Paenibacillus lupini]